MREMKKGEVFWDTMIPWILAILVLIGGLMVYLIVSGKMGNWGEAIRNFFRFRT